MRGNIKFIEPSEESYDGSGKVKFEIDEMGLWDFVTSPVPNTKGIVDYAKTEGVVVPDPRFVCGIDPVSISGKEYFELNGFIHRHMKRIKFRLPRKLKKKVKNRVGCDVACKHDLEFYYEAYKTARYYGCRVLLEKNGR